MAAGPWGVQPERCASVAKLWVVGTRKAPVAGGPKVPRGVDGGGRSAP